MVMEYKNNVGQAITQFLYPVAELKVVGMSRRNVFFLIALFFYVPLGFLNLFTGNKQY